MFAFRKHARIAMMTLFALAMTGQAGPPAGVAPPNWKGSASGSTVLNHFYQDGNVLHRVDDDNFAGKSSHLGRFTATGSHDLNLTTFEFVGYATWTAANGDTLDVVYDGQLFFGPLPAYPFEFVATLYVVGGTGRFAGAQGHADWSGAFSGDGMIIPVPVPNVFYFSFDGTLDMNGN